MAKEVEIRRKILSENDRHASDIRGMLEEKGIVSLNLVSSPGAGKTSLLEKTLAALSGKLRMALIAGDVQTENDADRLTRAGGKAVRAIVTGGACHLDAKMVAGVLRNLSLDETDLLLIENVGNLVCPASFDLGEDMKVVLFSTTEGDDKPLKYPAMFRRSSALVINKTDLIGLSDFSLDTARQNAGLVNPELKTFEVSCRSGQGLEVWYRWLKELVKEKQGR
jgi:hydrogenase nickel incorporation protein HypB